MRTVGLIGGMSWESSAIYYRLLNERVRERFGGVCSCPCLLHSVDFAEIARLQHANDWEALNARMARCAEVLERGGADCIVLCTNTMHLCCDAIEAASRLPLLHIASASGNAIQQRGIRRVGLLGTRFTMEQPFYSVRLRTEYGIETVIPDEAGREAVHRIIYEELVRGKVLESSRRVLQEQIGDMLSEGIEGVILGCTELPLLLRSGDFCVDGCSLPLFDTTSLHVDAALEFATKQYS